MIEEKLVKILSKVMEKDIKIEDLSEVNLIEEYAINSLEALQLIIEIEKQFNILIDDEEKIIEAFHSFKALSSYIKVCMNN